MSHLFRHTRNERGVAFPLAGIGILAVLGYGIVTLEIGQISIVKSEMQNAADAGAIAGAEALIEERSVDPDVRDTVLANSVSSRTGGHGLTDDNIVSIQVGNYTSGGGFVANLPPTNAVEVVVSEVVDNLGYRAADNSTTSTMGARSVAAMVPAAAPPTLPVVIGDCLLPPPGQCFSDSCLPTLTGVTTGPLRQTRWTSLFDSPTRANVLAKFPAMATCGANCNAQGLGQVEVLPGDDIYLRGATLDALAISCVQTCYIDAGITSVIVPVISCEMNSLAKVIGHAHFEILSAYDANGQPELVLRGRIAPPQTVVSVGESWGLYTASLVE